MKTRLLLIACLFALGVGRSEGAILFASGTIERLSVTDYQLDVYAIGFARGGRVSEVGLGFLLFQREFHRR